MEYKNTNTSCQLTEKNLSMETQRHSQDFREGGADVCTYVVRAQILSTLTYEMERSKFKLSQRTSSESS